MKIIHEVHEKGFTALITKADNGFFVSISRDGQGDVVSPVFPTEKEAKDWLDKEINK